MRVVLELLSVIIDVQEALLVDSFNSGAADFER